MVLHQFTEEHSSLTLFNSKNQGGVYVNSKAIGNSYEIQAAHYLISKGYNILDHNYRCRYGEIDLIAKAPDQTIVFIEVKSRRSLTYGNAIEAVTPDKCNKIRKTSKFYIHEKKTGWNQMYRYDVIVFQNNHMEHIINAFY